jgi:hypothetical protein
MCFTRARVMTAIVALSLMTSTMIATALARGGRGGGRLATHGSRFSSQTANRIGHDNRRIGRSSYGPRRPGSWGPRRYGYGPAGIWGPRYGRPGSWAPRPPRQPTHGGPSGVGQPQPTGDRGLRPTAQEQTIPRNNKVNWKVQLSGGIVSISPNWPF